MKRLVLLGEGQGEQKALPVLARKLLADKKAGDVMYVDSEVIRTPTAGLAFWNKSGNHPDFSKWIRYVKIASRRREVGGVLAIYDGDLPSFPSGSGRGFCASQAARALAAEAKREAGAGVNFSLAVVYACTEYESWLIASAKSLAGKKLADGRTALPAGVQAPEGDPESHGKKWLHSKFTNYSPARDQAMLTELMDFKIIRSLGLRSFKRLENAVDQLLEGVRSGSHICTPS